MMDCSPPLEQMPLETPATSTVKSLNSLPVEVYQFYMFPHLHIEDIHNLRLVSKKMASAVESYRFKELSFQTHNFHQFEKCFNKIDNWFSTTESIRLENQLDECYIPLIRNPSDNFLNIRRLKIYIELNPFKLSDLNKFTMLQVLEIAGVYFSQSVQLNLPDLRAIDFGQSISGTGDFVMITPKLHSVSTVMGSDLRFVQFQHIDTVKYLRLGYYDKFVSKFINLECLELKHTEGLVIDNLLKLRCLKKIKFNYFVKSMINTLKDLYFINSLNLILEGVLIKDTSKIHERKNSRNKLEFQLNNYDELEDDLNFTNAFFYIILCDIIPGPYYRTSDLFKKYTNIQELQVKSEVNDENHLISLIRCLKNLHSFTALACELSPKFYDTLPKISTLSFLDIENAPFEEFGFNLDYRFLMAMPYLCVLRTDQDVLIDNNLNLNNLRYLQRISCCFNNLKNEITKMGKDRYRLSHYELEGRYLKFDELIQCTKLIRDKKFQLLKELFVNE